LYLVDTNIWLELLLEQTNADEVKQFLEQIPLALHCRERGETRRLFEIRR